LPVNLSLVWFDDTNYAFHAPEACMNNIMLDREMVSIRIGNSGNHEVIKMIVEINNQKQILIYFFDVDGFFTTSQSMIRLESLIKRFQLKRTSATFVRIMAPIEENQSETMKVLLKFLDDIYPVLPGYTYTNKILLEHGLK
jgi:EpsI family protein